MNFQNRIDQLVKEFNHGAMALYIDTFTFDILVITSVFMPSINDTLYTLRFYLFLFIFLVAVITFGGQFLMVFTNI